MTDDEETADPASGRDPGSEQVGSVADEAAKLFGALSGWAREHGSDLGHQFSDLAGTAAHMAAEVDEHVATGDPECRYCPVCRTVHLARQASPEVREHLAVAASSLLQAAAGVLATAVPPEQSDPDRSGAGGGRRRGSVERIDLDDDPEPAGD